MQTLSYSKIRPFLNGCTKEALLEFANYCLIERETTEACLLGQAVHARLQGIEFTAKTFSANSLGFPDFRSKEAREARDKALADGRTKVSEDFEKNVETIVNEALANPVIAQSLKRKFEPEKQVVGNVSGFSFRGFIDIYRKPTKKKCGEIIDIKTVAQFEKALRFIDDFYHQLYLYNTLCEDNNNLKLIVIETVDPYRSAVICCTVYVNAGRTSELAVKRAATIAAGQLEYFDKNGLEKGSQKALEYVEKLRADIERENDERKLEIKEKLKRHEYTAGAMSWII